MSANAPVNSRLKREAQWCKTALGCQLACNSSGVVHTLKDILGEMVDEGIPTRERNTHPAVKLIVNKLADLSGMVCDYPLGDEERCEAIIKLADS